MQTFLYLSWEKPKEKWIEHFGVHGNWTVGVSWKTKGSMWDCFTSWLNFVCTSLLARRVYDIELKHSHKQVFTYR